MKLISFLSAVLAVTLSWGQYDGKDSLVASRYRPGFMWFDTGLRPAKIGKPRKYDRLIIDLTHNSWLNDKQLEKVNFLQSIGMNVNTMWDIPLNEGNGFALGVGFRYSFQRVGYKGGFVVDSTDSYVNLNQNPSYDVSKSVFGSHTFSVPLEIRFRMKKWRHAKLHLGGSVGYRVGTYTKEWFNDQDLVIKNKHFNDASGLTYGVHARLGIRNWAFFAEYTLSKQFENSKSTVLNPISFGISLSVF